MPHPRTLAEAVELAATPDIDRDEYLGGYGLLGLQFDSGHLLAMRRVPLSSFGPAYTSIWHRDPAGDWTIYLNVPPFQGCPRYFGSALKGAVETPIELNWTADRDFSLSVPEIDLEWSVQLGSTIVTRALNIVGGAVPRWAWRRRFVLDVVARAAAPLLGIGPVALRGDLPNGQWFRIVPLPVWRVAGSRASLAGQDLGAVVDLHERLELGDFIVPRRGLFFVGSGDFEGFDASRHRLGVAPGA
jgi:hypothetical protein